MNNDQQLIAEAYNTIYKEGYAEDDLRARALDHEDEVAATEELNRGNDKVKLFKNTETKYVRYHYQPEGYKTKLFAYGVVTDVTPEHITVTMRSGPDEVDRSGPGGSEVPNKFQKLGKKFNIPYEIKQYPKRTPVVIFKTPAGTTMTRIGSSINAGQLDQYEYTANNFKTQEAQLQ